MAFKHTRYLGGKRYQSNCVKCKEPLVWTEGENVPMVFFPDQDIGVLCSKCYSFTKKRKIATSRAG